MTNETLRPISSKKILSGKIDTARSDENCDTNMLQFFTVQQHKMNCKTQTIHPLPFLIFPLSLPLKAEEDRLRKKENSPKNKNKLCHKDQTTPRFLEQNQYKLYLTKILSLLGYTTHINANRWHEKH